GLLARLRVERGRPLPQLHVLARQSLLQVLEPVQTDPQFLALLLERLPLLRARALLRVDGRAEALGLAKLILDRPLGPLLPGPLLGERLCLLPDLVAQPFQSGAQRREHGLLALDERGPLG